ncbi:hypothetical protein ASD81_16225 [Nocardioides sp. Root614]|nr:hypothetical protein ASD81_16225 [Nocardioides sp. Root614]KRA87660.1 hypothetical protein ASD84_16500 [Nocardioides sp. Root682]
MILCGAAVGAAVGEFPDLHVYRYGGTALIDQWPIYDTDDPITGYPFTYTPVAAVLLAPLALVPGWLAAAVWTGASAGCLATTVILVRRELGRPTPGWLVAFICLGSLALEPMWQNFAFGQINLILMLAVLMDLLKPERRTAGILLGIAAGVKLTPLVFVVLLALAGRRRAAGRAVAAFAGTVVVGLVAVPGATSYWTERLLDPNRVGPPALAHNQSVSGTLTRLLGEVPSTTLWLLVAGPVSVAIVLVAAKSWRNGDRVLGSSLGAMAMLLASPISWSHHWVWALPVGLLLWERSRPAAVLWTTLFAARPVLWPPWGQGREYAWRGFDHVVGNAYVLAAITIAAVAFVALRRNREDARSLTAPGPSL